MVIISLMYIFMLFISVIVLLLFSIWYRHIWFLCYEQITLLFIDCNIENRLFPMFFCENKLGLYNLLKHFLFKHLILLYYEPSSLTHPHHHYLVII